MQAYTTTIIMYTALVSRSGCKQLDNGDSALLPSKYKTFLPFSFFQGCRHTYVMALHLETIKKKAIIVWILMALLQENTITCIWFAVNLKTTKLYIIIVYNYNCTMVEPKIKGFSHSLNHIYNCSDHSHGIWQLYHSPAFDVADHIKGFLLRK